MKISLVTTSAVLALLAGPAFADCAGELQSLDQTLVSAETGASTDPTGMPATQHQAEVLGGKQASDTGTAEASTDAGGASPAGAATEHQKETTSNQPSVATGERGESASSPSLSQLSSEAKKSAAAGDEAGCMAKLAEIRTQLGMK